MQMGGEDRVINGMGMAMETCACKFVAHPFLLSRFLGLGFK